MIEQKTVERIYQLTAATLLFKSVQEHYYSVVEELGELAEALKVKQGFFGAGHKTLKEPVTGEVADLLICGIMMSWFDNNAEALKDEQVKRFFDAYNLLGITADSGISEESCHYYLHRATEFVAKIGKSLEEEYNHLMINATCLVGTCAFLFLDIKEPEDDINAIMNKKLDKWENNQNAEFQRTVNEQTNGR